MTESGGTGNTTGSGVPPADEPTGAGTPGGPGGTASPPAPDATTEAAVPEMPRYQPFADPPPAAPMSGHTPMPPEPPDSTWAPPLEEDTGTIVPGGMHDAPEYVPTAMGMTSGSILPPLNSGEESSSAWITTAPQTAPQAGGIRGGIGSIIGAIVLIVVVGAVVAGILGLLPSDKGKVLFGTAAGSDLCSVANQATTMKPTDPIFFAAILKHHMDGAQAITFKITKDGADFVDHDEPADGTSFDCYGNKESLGTLEAGSYVFSVVHNGDIEATGALIVK